MDTASKIWMGIAMALFVVILVLVWLLFTIPAPNHSAVATSTSVTETKPTPQPETSAANQPLSARVRVTSPAANTTVGSMFEIKGEAPGNWFFEASFPIQVRDENGTVVARTHASAQGEWMTTDLVQFTSTINIETAYKGPATLILMRDNPSGLPENDDAVEVPITIN